ncbi:hypothetical protein DI272_19050 [Streptomyces sp. Act143]|uniref:hypothetical protein n=1 Tax=Streptomyces sp. Act143 TaxID=2200760 RepID=UPI000D677480|nr:hypothetical protein [Streptomyces sp. Act143]PWI16032.1 hypothetical protein DI272_19050 [Streptomyces sp. Act143]
MATPEQPPAQPYGQMPNIVINNVSSASASASAAASAGYGVRRRRQSFWVHFWLLWLTCGIGNYFYARHVSNWNRDRGL